MKQKFYMKSLGDSALLVYFGEEISRTIHGKVQALFKLLQDRPFKGFKEGVPAYTNLCVYYDPLLVAELSNEEMPDIIVRNYISTLIEHMEITQQQGRIVEIPVIYGGEYGPDLAEVAAYNHLTEAEVIRRHSESDVLVYMLGFAPGFAFMGGMDESIAMPRRDVPRAKIPAGSVGIAGKQTGIYPFETPGGWNIIGRTTTPLFLPDENPPSLLRAGDRIRFVPITNDREDS